ncbi:flagellin N-terminal helical domain-containing protein [Desulforegula conservatrix]|uniref:flagellin N-terminal helical domain-containing protein n=1 Tax=Desulforegula conservatrix TaxID=153026 RepID=UPI0004193B5D|nr:flagellin [Desulforegula conservatrix]
MGLRINTNLQALTAHKNLTKTDAGLSQSLERLSSGLRINKAADDASGLAIADNLRAQHTGIAQAISNANDGVNIIQIADGALEESLNIVTTIRSKAIQAASDAQNLSSRKAIQADVNKLLEELQMIGETTAYNGLALLDGTFINKVFHVGAYKDETVSVNVDDARATKIGAMAYAKTNRNSVAAVSDPFLKGGTVTSEALIKGDIRANSINIGSSVNMLATYGSTDSAWAKAAAINGKVNESGVQAKATTELIINVGTGIGAATLNGVALTGAVTDNALVSVINNNASFKAMGIAAEHFDGQVRLVANDGRNLVLAGAAGGASMNGMAITTITQRGSLTLSNARAMVNSEAGIAAGSVSTGDLLINGVDVAAGGALAILAGDGDRTLVTSINNNRDLQALGIRAELYKETGDVNFRLRIISEKEPVTISGADPHKVAQLISGTREGVKTTGVVMEGAATDSVPTDNFIQKIGFDGARFGSRELNGASNSGGNDVAVVSKSYLTGTQVSKAAIVAGDLFVNGIALGATVSQFTVFGSANTAWAKAAAINEKINLTGVAAKATTELVIGVGPVAAGLNLNGISIGVAAGATAAMVVSNINTNTSLQAMGIRAELIGSEVRIVGDDGRNLSLAGAGATGVTLNGQAMAGLSYVARGALSLTNARAMVNGEVGIQAGSINEGELIINGIDIARGGSLSIKAGDADRTLVNAINNNGDLQKMGIRAELYKSAGDTDFRLRIISERDPLTVGGNDPSKVAKMLPGVAEGTRSSQIKLSGALVDSSPTSDNYLEMLGLGGIHYGASEETGIDNTPGNDLLFFGVDTFSYKSGDVSINGYKIGQPVDDGISHALGDKSAAAWAAAINLVKDETGVEADIIKANVTGAGSVVEGVLTQGDFKINGIDIVRDNTGGKGMQVLAGDADHALMNAINEYKDQTKVIASIDNDGKLVLSALDGRNIHVESTAAGNKYIKFEADFGPGKGVAQDSVYMGEIRLVADTLFQVDGAGSSASGRELSLMRMGLAGGGTKTEATSDLRGDGTLIAGINYDTAISTADVTTQQGAEMVIRSADFAIKRLDSIRSGLGSVQNQLTSTVANLSVTKINVQSTESTIRDVDFAQESSVFSKMQVLMQAGTYAQSQANASAQNVMRLLQ